MSKLKLIVLILAELNRRTRRRLIAEVRRKKY